MNYDAEYSTYVGNLDQAVPAADLEELVYELFMQAGPVEKVYFPLDPVTGQHKNHGFVEFEHQESVPYAILLLNGVCLFGRPLRVGEVGKTAVFPAVGDAADTATTTGNVAETADAAAKETLSSDLAPQDKLAGAAAALLTAQLQLGLPLNKAELPANGPTPPPSSATGIPASSGPAPFFSVPISSNGEVQPPRDEQMQTTSLFGPTTPLGSKTWLPQVPSSSSLHPPPLLLPSSDSTLLFGKAPNPSSNNQLHLTLSTRLSPPLTNNVTQFGHRLPPSPNGHTHSIQTPFTSSTAPRLSPPHNSHLGDLRNSDTHPTLGHRLSPPPNNPPYLSFPLCANNEMHPVSSGRISPPSQFGPNGCPPWGRNDVTNGNGCHTHIWDQDSPNHIGDHLWDEKPSNGPVPSWKQFPGVASSNHRYRSRWSPNRIGEERGFRKDRPSDYREEMSDFRNHSISNHCRTGEKLASHSDEEIFSGAYPFASDHTHRRLHENRLLHSNDKPSWVTQGTKDRIRNHHLTKLTETQVQYQQVYSRKC